jgi:hypothetical protein
MTYSCGLLIGMIIHQFYRIIFLKIRDASSSKTYNIMPKSASDHDTIISTNKEK